MNKLANQNVKVVILCGGMGTRLREETEFKPKPMVEIGGKPILWHIMKIYAFHGFKDFVLCLGYKGEKIKEYILNYEMMSCDITVKLGSGNVKVHNSPQEQGWQITLADTGKNAMTGARVKRIEKYVDGDFFMLSYGDGVADIDIKKLLEFHKSHGKIGTVTGVRPSSRFGELVIEGGQVVEFSEKPQIQDGFINGGFFVFNKNFFGYLKDDDDCTLEGEPLEHLASDGELIIYKHKGFWQCMDTYRDMTLLNDLWKTKSPWKVWKD
jgi:glucose-1-phosphate cytidylyltransferase